MAGVVPTGDPNLPEQSAKSVYPLAIANCKENRYEVTKISTYFASFIFFYIVNHIMQLCSANSLQALHWVDFFKIVLVFVCNKAVTTCKGMNAAHYFITGEL